MYELCTGLISTTTWRHACRNSDMKIIVPVQLPVVRIKLSLGIACVSRSFCLILHIGWIFRPRPAQNGTAPEAKEGFIVFIRGRNNRTRIQRPLLWLFSFIFTPLPVFYLLNVPKKCAKCDVR